MSALSSLAAVARASTSFQACWSRSVQRTFGSKLTGRKSVLLRCQYQARNQPTAMATVIGAQTQAPHQ